MFACAVSTRWQDETVRIDSLPTVLLISVAGAGGALARYGLEQLWPHQAGGVPWATLAANLSGCLLIGVLSGWLARHRAPAWCRPVLGIGFLGGYTTFSAYAVQWMTLVVDGRPFLGAVYLLGTLGGAMAAVYLGAALTDRPAS
ncbi:CrcB protein [Stackebrandtia endophytica]|uniref:Fluoride-specific ion channel FluC n=1 Tax=Stackebrandtia endophytica TaxID=1496996 RepID=A0A543AWG4_9ACTN|nr:CrcB protein [Stackebrandtia endophytica]